jgi:hypothetical protein
VQNRTEYTKKSATEQNKNNTHSTAQNSVKKTQTKTQHRTEQNSAKKTKHRTHRTVEKTKRNTLREKRKSKTKTQHRTGQSTHKKKTQHRIQQHKTNTYLVGLVSGVEARMATLRTSQAHVTWKENVSVASDTAM